MIRKNTSGDINNEEFEKFIKPFSDNYNKYFESYIISKNLTNNIKMLKNESKKINTFNENYFAAGMPFLLVLMHFMIIRIQIVN